MKTIYYQEDIERNISKIILQSTKGELIRGDIQKNKIKLIKHTEMISYRICCWSNIVNFFHPTVSTVSGKLAFVLKNSLSLVALGCDRSGFVEPHFDSIFKLIFIHSFLNTICAHRQISFRLYQSVASDMKFRYLFLLFSSPGRHFML